MTKKPEFTALIALKAPDVDPPDNTSTKSFAEDLLRGASMIALFLFKSDGKQALRTVFHLLSESETKAKSLPAFKMGSMWCMRISTYLALVWARERRAFKDEHEEELVRLHLALGNLTEQLAKLLLAEDASEGLRLAAMEAKQATQRVLQAES